MHVERTRDLTFTARDDGTAIALATTPGRLFPVTSAWRVARATVIRRQGTQRTVRVFATLDRD